MAGDFHRFPGLTGADAGYRDRIAGLCRPARSDRAEGDSETPGREAWERAQALDRGGDARAVGDAAVRAAQAALRGGDPLTAARRFAFAARRTESGAARSALRRREAEALLSAGRFAAAGRRFLAALRGAAARAERAALRTEAAFAWAAAGHSSRARAAAEAAVAEAGSDPALRGRARRALAASLDRLDETDLAVTTIARARSDLARAEAPEDEQAALVLAEAMILGHAGHERAAKALRSVADAELAPQDRRVALAARVASQAREGKLNRAQETLDRLRQDSTDPAGRSTLEAAVAITAGSCARFGLLDRALELDREALELSAGDGDRHLAAGCRLADTLRRCGRPGEAVQLLREALAERVETDEDPLGDAARLLLAASLSSDGRGPREVPDGLLARVLPRLRRRREPGWSWVLALGLVIDLEHRARSGGADPADPTAAEWEALVAREEIEPELRWRAELALGRVRLARGDPEAAVTRATRAVDLALAHGGPLDEAAAQALLWSALQQAGTPGDASRAAERARRLLGALDEKIRDANVRRDVRARPLFRGLTRTGAAMGEGARLAALYEMIRAINTEDDPDALLAAILDMTLRAVSAERGMILLRERSGEEFSVGLSRNVERETERDAEGFSRGIVERAGSGESLLVLDAGSDERFANLESVSRYGIRSLMCVPLTARGSVIGTVYVDSRRDAGVFGRDDLRFLEAFARHASNALRNALRRRELRRENRRLEAEADERTRYGNIVGRSEGMQRAFDKIERVAESDLPVLILGESGTGKELVARAIHAAGPRARKIFLSENCAAVPDSLLESELFGHVKGAFTGADRDRPGLFEEADGGTLFLDEVGEMSPAMQARLLRVVQEGEVRRVGADKVGRVGVRLIAATHRDLDAEARAGRFRQDLLYRLQVLPIVLPPLRERPGDVPLLARHVLERACRERGIETPRLAGEVLDALERHSWPGNVRQLENALQRLLLLARGGPITAGVVRSDPTLARMLLGRRERRPAVLARDRGERERIREALEAAGGNRNQAARLLGISRATIYRKIRQHGL